MQNPAAEMNATINWWQKSKLLFILFVSSFIFYSCSNRQSASLIFEKLKRCDSSKTITNILCGTYSVFENRQTNTGRKIDLNIVVIPAIHRERLKSPIFYLEGGPGGAATSMTSFYADSINYYRLEHDIVLIDARGTGGSNPLHCNQLQYKTSIEDHLSEMYPAQAVQDCYDSLSKLADLTQYTSTNMAMDMEEVRKWLGYDKISLFALSGGGRLAQVYMKKFPGSVESTVLWSPTTPYSRMPLYHAQYAQESINKLFEDCANDSKCKLAFPNIKEEFIALMQKGKEKPFRYLVKEEDGNTKELIIPRYAFHTKIRSLLYAPDGMRQIPFIIHQSYLGNWQPFISLFPGKASFDDSLAEGLYLCITCTEDIPFFTQQEADSLSAGTFMEKYRIEQQVNACAHWAKGIVPDDFFEPLQSDIPTAVLSGYFDPVTPPSMAEKIVQTLPNGVLIKMPAMSHVLEGLSHPECFDKIVVDFFNNPGTKPDCGCIAQMQPGEYRIN